MSTKTKSGICYLIGAGPGDPGLLTIKGKQCIEKAEVVIYDYLCNPELLNYASAQAELIYVGKKAGDHNTPQVDINTLLVEKCGAGKIVARLKGGDPLVFGRGGEEAEELFAAGIAFELVPGISSAIAGPAYAGIPVTHRAHNTQLTIFTGHEDPEKPETSIDFAQIAQAPGTKVMLMGVGNLAHITEQLESEGMAADTPVAMIRWATHGKQESVVGTLASIAEVVEKAGFKAPAVAVFGGVVGLRDKLNWFEKRPLRDNESGKPKKVVVTRTRKQAGALSDKLRALGADAIELPTIRIAPPEDELAFGRMVQDVHTYDWLVFTSPNGVDRFFELFYKLYKDAREIGGVRIAAIGPGTEKRILENRLSVDLMPESQFVAEGLVEAFDKETTLDNQKVLWVKALETRSVLSDYFESKLAILDEAIAYQTVPETELNRDGIARLANEGADVITFTSSSTVESFIDLGIEIPAHTKVASIGPVTSATLQEHGLPVDTEAKEHTIDGLVKAVCKLLGHNYKP